MNLTGARVLRCWLVLVSLLITGCISPAASRLVTIKLVKPPAVDVQWIRTVGVVPFKSPERSLGRHLAEEVASKLNRAPWSTRVMGELEGLSSETASLSSLTKNSAVDALLLGEVTEYSVKVSREEASMVTEPDFGEEDPGSLAWVDIRENPTIGDTTYFVLKSSRSPSATKVPVTRALYALALNVRLIEASTGKIAWELQVSRHLGQRMLPGSPVDMEAEVVQLQRSMVKELVSYLQPQESTIQRMLRAPRLSMEPKAARLVRQGIQAAGYDNWARAEQLFREAAQLAPNEANIHGNLGVVYERDGRFLEAVAAYELASRCQPRDPTYHYYSGDLQTAFVPDLHKENLPTLVLGVRGDGVLYLDGGIEGRHHIEDVFGIYRTEVKRDQHSRYGN
jgi:hypothetical protein